MPVLSSNSSPCLEHDLFYWDRVIEPFGNRHADWATARGEHESFVLDSVPLSMPRCFRLVYALLVSVLAILSAFHVASSFNASLTSWVTSPRCLAFLQSRFNRGLERVSFAVGDLRRETDAIPGELL